MEENILKKRCVPNYFKKFLHLVIRNRSINTRNFVDRLAEVYGDRPVFFLDSELPTPFSRVARSATAPSLNLQTE